MSPKLFLFFVTWARFPIWHFTYPKMFFCDGPSDELQSFFARSSNVLISYIGVMSQRCTKRLPTFWVRCSGERTSGQHCLMTQAFCPLTPGGRWHNQFVVPDIWSWVARGASNDREPRVVFRCSVDICGSCMSPTNDSIGCVCGKCPGAARLHHQRAESTRKPGVDRIRRVPTVSQS